MQYDSEKVRTLRTALNDFIGYCNQFSHDELMRNRTFNECLSNAEMAKFYADILVGERDNPIPNYGY